MKRFTKRALALLISAFIVCAVSGQMLKVSGKKIVNSSTNQEVLLNAMNLGNWMVMEGYIMGTTEGASYQHDIKEKLRALIGEANTNTFFNAWLNNYVTQADVNLIKSWGFNSIRLPIHYEYFTSLTQDVWYTQGFTLLDNVIGWCKAAGIYAIIDLHAAPGGQGTGDICDYDNTKPSLWESQANRDKTVALWKKISERYKNEAWVAGYDLINETHWANANEALRTLYGNITNAVRGQGDNHILFIEGNWYANDFGGLTPAWDANMVYSFHKYWSNNDQQALQGYLTMRDQENRPLWCGETGENSNSHFTMTMELFNQFGIGASWWPYKKFESINGFMSANWAPGYKAITDYWAGKGPNPGATAAYNSMMQLAENIKLANCKVNTDVVRAVITQPASRSNTSPFGTNTIPGTLFAPNYDYGFQDFAYWDEVWENRHVSTGTYTAWNSGWAYRNDGVDIEPCSDAQSNGFSIGWITPGEWTQYTTTVQTSGTYLIEARVANGGTTATLQVKDGASTVIASISIPSTGGWSTWSTYSVTNVTIMSGSKPIRIYCSAGGYNLAQVKFTLIKPISDAPIGQTIWLQNSGKYVSSNNGTAPITCDRTSAQGWEKFDVIDAGNAKIALRGSNGLYVSSENGSAPMTCTRTSYSDWEKFEWVKISSTQVALKGNNGKYVSSENGATTGMNCNRATYQGWEIFTWATTTKSGLIEDVNDNSISSTTPYPNPCTNNLHFENLKSASSIEFYDFSGKVVFKKPLSDGSNNINVSLLSKGMYMVKILGANSVEFHKIVKK